jgi:hypothetical protein
MTNLWSPALSVLVSWSRCTSAAATPSTDCVARTDVSSVCRAVVAEIVGVHLGMKENDGPPDAHLMSKQLRFGQASCARPIARRLKTDGQDLAARTAGLTALWLVSASAWTCGCARI